MNRNQESILARVPNARAVAFVVLALAACASEPPPSPVAPPSGPVAERRATSAVGPAQASSGLGAWAKGAMLFDNLGTLKRPVRTDSAEAQSYFDQGLRLNFGFNHDESTRSFARAAEIDPRCAACFWGVALTLGPNYNVPMLPDRAATAWGALERA